MKRFLTPIPKDFPVAARDRVALENYFNGNVRTLGKRKAENVLVVMDKNGNEQVWVKPGYPGYKKAFETIHGLMSSYYQLDHVYSNERAKQQRYKYVRLFPVKGEVNRAWGGRWESRTTNIGKKGFTEPRGTPEIRNIDQWQWWKIQGIMPKDTPYGERATSLSKKSVRSNGGFSAKRCGPGHFVIPGPLGLKDV